MKILKEFIFLIKENKKIFIIGFLAGIVLYYIVHVIISLIK